MGQLFGACWRNSGTILRRIDRTGVIEINWSWRLMVDVADENWSFWLKLKLTIFPLEKTLPGHGTIDRFLIVVVIVVWESRESVLYKRYIKEKTSGWKAEVWFKCLEMCCGG